MSLRSAPAGRILIAGTTGVGKTTLAKRLAGAWNLPYTELDSLFHGPNWTQRAEFEVDVSRIASGNRWVSEWSYFSHGAGAVLGARGEVVLWLNYPRPLAWLRLFRRTRRRAWRREVLWNGNIEQPLRTVFTNPDHILRWEWKTHRSWEKRMPTLVTQFPQLTILRFRHPRLLERWLAGDDAAAEIFA